MAGVLWTGMASSTVVRALLDAGLKQGGEVVMVVINNIVDIDRGCAGIFGGDVAVVAGVVDDAGGVG